MTNLDHTLPSLEQYIQSTDSNPNPFLAGLCWDLAREHREEFQDPWLSNPTKLLKSLDPSLREKIDKELSTLSWFPDHGTWTVERSRQRDQMPMKLPFDFAWMHITFEQGEMSSIPHGTLRDVRDVLLKIYTPEGASVAERQRRDEHFVLMVAIDGPSYRVPDLAVIGPSQPISNGEATPEMVKTVFVDLNRTVQESGFEDQYLQQKLSGLQKLGHPKRWRETFETSLDTREKIRKQFSNRLRSRMERLMNCLEKTVEASPDSLPNSAFEDVADPDKMKSAREAATLLVFRLLFLSELESRRLLYHGDSPVSDAILIEYAADIRAAHAEGDDAPTDRNMLRRLAHLTQAVRIEDSTADEDVALSGGSIFSNRPNDRFSSLPGVWLDALEQALETGTLDEDIRREWNDALARTCELVTGFVDDEVQLSRTRAGTGAAEHTHRIFGDVYEQLLRYTPHRTEEGAIELDIDDEERDEVMAHYTPAPLVEEVTRPTLGRLFAQYWEEAEGDPDAYLEQLRTCTLVDPAMGSAHFLTVAALELAREIAWVRLNDTHRPFDWHRPLEHENPIGPDPDENEDEGPKSASPSYDEDAQGSQQDFDRLVAEELPRLVQHCVYGVDVKPIACELGKLALWLFTMAVQEDAAETDGTRSLADDLVYLDANIRSGDSLVGMRLTDVKTTIEESLRSENSFSGKEATLFGVDEQTDTLRDKLERADRYLQALRDGPEQLTDEDIGYLEDALDEPLFPNQSAGTYEKKERVDRAVRAALQDLRWVFDLTLAIRYLGYTSRSREGRASRLHAVLFGDEPVSDDTSEIKSAVEEGLQSLFDSPDSEEAQEYRRNITDWADGRPDLNRLHWELTFPDVFAHDGFDAILANPPFIGDRNLNGRLESTELVSLLANYFIPQQKKSEYAGFFFWRYNQIAKSETGVVGSLATNSIAQASNRIYVTKPLTTGDNPGFHVFRTLPNREWPSEANVHFAALYLSRQRPEKQYIVQPDYSRTGNPERALEVDRISSYLDEYPDFDLQKLLSETPPVSQGMILRGNFSVHRQTGDSLADAVEAVPEDERDALAAFLSADDVQRNPRPTPSDVVIDFFEPLKHAGLADANPDEQLTWLQENYPDLLGQLQKRSDHTPEKKCVYEQRKALSDSDDNTPHKRYWWLFGRARTELRKVWDDVERVVAFPRIIKVWTPFYLPKHIQISEQSHALRMCPVDKIYSAPTFESEHFAITSSFLFEIFARRQSSTLKSDLNFSPTNAFPYFPWPWEPEMDGHQLTIGEPDVSTKTSLSQAADTLLDLRTDILERPAAHGLTRQQVGGPTDLYNLYDDDPSASDGADAPAIEKLRQAHVDLLNAVLYAYGWDDLADELDRDTWTFDHPWLDRSERFVPPEPIRAELFNRIDQLNRKRYEQERELLTDFIVQNLPQNGLTKSGFEDEEPFTKLPIDKHQFEAFMEAEEKKMTDARVRKDRYDWKPV
ncbi:Eco57I restriction-modification methylase domain-containing protein [Salinibacter ruber]|uniref:Eco57I restriction-modification methylase domain-containing protein n=1 Tax=Salinibacter ruber TaxID=146919 RepID=UPI000E5863B5|nr:hypothetical protein [Salinibacter ruber]